MKVLDALIRGRSPGPRDRKRFWTYVVLLLFFVGIVGLVAGQLGKKIVFQYSIRCMGPEVEPFVVMFVYEKDADEYFREAARLEDLTYCHKTTLNVQDRPGGHEAVLKRMNDED